MSGRTRRNAPPASLSAGLSLLLAVACGLIVGNIYYAQPLIGEISQALGLSLTGAGIIVTMTQVGYGLGLLLVVPLGDLFENRRLTLVMMAVSIAALATAMMSQTITMFLTAALFIGLGSVAVQLLVPYAAHLSPKALQGRAVGNVMSGLMLGKRVAVFRYRKIYPGRCRNGNCRSPGCYYGRAFHRNGGNLG